MLLNCHHFGPSIIAQHRDSYNQRRSSDARNVQMVRSSGGCRSRNASKTPFNDRGVNKIAETCERPFQVSYRIGAF